MASRIIEQDEPAASFEDDNGLNPQRMRDQSPTFAKPTDAAKAAAVDALFGDGPVAPPHALDDAPVNSKIVVIVVTLKKGDPEVRRGVLATPASETLLPEGDIAHRLPIGSKIYKVADGDFRAMVPDPYAYCSNVGITAGDVLQVATDRLVAPPPTE